MASSSSLHWSTLHCLPCCLSKLLRVSLDSSQELVSARASAEWTTEYLVSLQSSDAADSGEVRAGGLPETGQPQNLLEFTAATPISLRTCRLREASSQMA